MATHRSPRTPPGHRASRLARPGRAYIVRDRRQVRALASVPRQAIVDIVAAIGPCPIRVVAARLGRPPGALYHHVRALRDVGLLTASAPASARGRPGVLLDVPGRPLVIRYEPDQPATRPPIRKVVAAMTRAASRDFVRAYRPGVSVSGDTRGLWAARAEAWLTDAGLRAVNRLLQRLVHRMQPGARRPDATSHPHSVTFVLAPMAALATRDAATSAHRQPRRRRHRAGRDGG
jgi:DNA-binding transcriptional ArsR family regulator